MRFGCVDEGVGDDVGDVIVDEFVNGKRVATTRPVLDERVLGLARAGLAELQAADHPDSQAIADAAEWIAGRSEP